MPKLKNFLNTAIEGMGVIKKLKKKSSVFEEDFDEDGSYFEKELRGVEEQVTKITQEDKTSALTEEKREITEQSLGEEEVKNIAETKILLTPPQEQQEQPQRPQVSELDINATLKKIMGVYEKKTGRAMQKNRVLLFRGLLERGKIFFKFRDMKDVDIDDGLKIPQEHLKGTYHPTTEINQIFFYVIKKGKSGQRDGIGVPGVYGFRPELLVLKGNESQEIQKTILIPVSATQPQQLIKEQQLPPSPSPELKETELKLKELSKKYEELLEENKIISSQMKSFIKAQNPELPKQIRDEIVEYNTQVLVKTEHLKELDLEIKDFDNKKKMMTELVEEAKKGRTLESELEKVLMKKIEVLEEGLKLFRGKIMQKNYKSIVALITTYVIYLEKLVLEYFTAEEEYLNKRQVEMGKMESKEYGSVEK